MKIEVQEVVGLDSRVRLAETTLDNLKMGAKKPPFAIFPCTIT